MSVDRLRYELRLLGKWVMLTPLFTLVCLTIFAEILHILNEAPERFLLAGLEMILPLIAGILVAAITTSDAAIELQLTLPSSYPTTVLRRFFLTTLWIICIAFAASSLLYAFNLWFMASQIQSWDAPLRFLAGQLAWLAPLLWFMMAGLCLSQLTHSRAAAATLLSGIWILETFLFVTPLLTFPAWVKQLLFLFATTLTPHLDFWLTNRVEVLITALLCLPVGWLLLRNTEGLLKGSSEE